MKKCETCIHWHDVKESTIQKGLMLGVCAKDSDKKMQTSASISCKCYEPNK